MDASIINWDKTPKGNDVEVLSLFYALKNVCETIARGAEVSELKLDIEGNPKVSEAGFREFLKAIVSVQWNVEQLNKNQIQSLNKIQEYLSLTYKQEEQPQVTGKMIAGFIKS